MAKIKTHLSQKNPKFCAPNSQNFAVNEYKFASEKS